MLECTYFEMVNKVLVALNQCRDWLLTFKADASVLADFFQLKGNQIKNPILIDVVVKALEKLSTPQFSSEYSRKYGLFNCKEVHKTEKACEIEVKRPAI